MAGDRVRSAFTAAGASPEGAQQSWYVFGLGIVQWLAVTGRDLSPGGTPPR